MHFESHKLRLCSSVIVIAGTLTLFGCGGSKSTPPIPASTPQFSVAAGTYATTQSVTISDSTPNATIYYTVDGSTPTTASTMYSGAISVSASETIQAIAMASNSTVSGVTQAAYKIVPPTVNATSFDFGQDLLGTTLTQTVATVSNTAQNDAPVTLSLTGNSSFSIVPSMSCGATVPANSTCAVVVAFNPAASGVESASLGVQFTSSPGTPAAVALTGTAGALTSGVVTPTTNPQVALYTITPPFQSTVKVEFGPTASYGFSTSTVSNAGGTAVNLQVAGMRASSTYHMRADVTFANGQTVSDGDHSFTTGALPPSVATLQGQITAAPTAGATPQPGIELMDTILGPAGSMAAATDLDGNVIWSYVIPDKDAGSAILYPIKMIANGDFIMGLAPTSQAAPLSPNFVPTGLDSLREVDLVGNTVHDLTMANLNSALVKAGFTGLNLIYFSHDVTQLPNGHMLVIANMRKAISGLTGYSAPVDVLGDLVIDLDTNWNPVWVWNEFDHFDPNRHPMQFPDWTHSNAVVYSPDDGNFLVSMRHQNWVVKVNYKDGAGDGSVLWKLGYQGDFALTGSTDSADWFYAQHNPVFFSTNTTGSFSLGLMDNGDDRQFSNGSNCLVQGGSKLCYTTIPVLQVDENAMTAAFTFHQVLSEYSVFAGDILNLANGNIEYNLAGLSNKAEVYEVTNSSNPQTIWKMTVAGENTYRAFRVPSLYPGVQW